MDLRLSRALRKLKRDFPLSCPVRVRTVEKLVCSERGRLFGCMEKHGDMFTIHIERHPDISVQIDTLWHEWAHCLLWPKSKNHRGQFWPVYGRIFSHYQD